MTVRQRQMINRQLTRSQEAGETGFKWTCLVIIAILFGVGLYYAF